MSTRPNFTWIGMLVLAVAATCVGGLAKFSMLRIKEMHDKIVSQAADLALE